MSTGAKTKGGIAEEALRQYFNSLGFFVSRSVPFLYSSYQITDVDLFLYIKKTPISRDRINVDIKRKRTPQAIERIFWTKGLQEVLGLDGCVVATTDKRPATREFGALHGVIVLDGKALSRLISYYKSQEDVLTEEGLVSSLDFASVVDSKTNWGKLYRECKQELLMNLDFNGFNRFLNHAKFAIDDYIASHNNSEPALRFLYISIAFLLIAVDFKSRHIAYLDSEERKNAFIEGFRYGEAGKKRADEILQTSLALAEHAGSTGLFTRNTLTVEIDRQLASFPAETLASYLSKTDIMKSLFDLGKQFHRKAFSSVLQVPKDLEPELKSIVGLLVDNYGFDRKKVL